VIAMLRRALALMRTRTAKVAADVDAEVEHHIELRARRFIEQGMPCDAAWAEARRRFGPTGTTRELIHAAHARERRMHWTDWLDGFTGDARYALRQLRRSPGFTATATITLALGIGANAVMFGVIDRLLLQAPAAVVDPATVVTASLTRTFTAPGEAAVRDTQAALSYPVYADLARTSAFERVAAYRARTLTLGNGLSARLVRGVVTTAGYFPLLGVRPSKGRFYTDAEADEAPGAEVVVLSHAFWTREFGGDGSAIGKTIELAGTPFRIVGIAPPGFTGPSRAPVDVWIPFTAGIPAERLAQWRRMRSSFFLYVVARLKRGTTIGTAVRAGSAAIEAGYLADGTPPDEVDRQRPGVALVSALPRDAHGGTAEARVSLLLAAVAFLVLVLACANVANLQLARTIQRRREIAVRLALGVARRRLLRQLALDSVLLALLGGLAALAIAYTGGELGRRSLVGFGLGDDPLVDGRVLAFTAIISMLAGLATGFVPALQTTRLELTNWLRSGAREGGGRSSRARLALLVLQATLTVILLAGTGMFVMSLRRVEGVRLGLEPDRVFRATVVTAGRAYTEAERRTMYEQLLRAAVGAPGVESAALATSMPFESASGTPVILPGRDSVPITREGGPYVNTVTAQFFRTIGTRLVVGRPFTDDDRAGTAPVVIVNQTAARLWWPGQGAVGKCIKIGADSMPCAQVVGVVENAKRFGIVEDESVQFYAPLDQFRSEGAPNVLYVRPARNSAAFQTQLQRRLQGAVPALPYVSIDLLSDVIAPRMQSWHLGAIMFGVFGALAVVLASVGLYGVLAYDVAQRQQELGVRLALGASRGNVAGLVLRRALIVVVTGSAIGLAATLAAGRIVEPMLFQTSPYDPLILGGVLLVVLVVSLLATMVPTARATRVDPAFALRSG
jgi:predicted permease